MMLPAPDSRAGNSINLHANDLGINHHSNSGPLLPNCTKAHVSGRNSQDAEYLHLNIIEILKYKLSFAHQIKREFFKC